MCAAELSDLEKGFSRGSIGRGGYNIFIFPSFF
jgi:hypothetical protein